MCDGENELTTEELEIISNILDMLPQDRHSILSYIYNDYISES
jgi:hypothetical protein